MPENYNSEDELDNREDDFEAKQTPDQGIGRGQKYTAIALGVFAVFVIGTWMVQFKKSINEPFAYQGTTASNEQSSVCQGPDCGQVGEEELKSKDTDGDGLSDWDEFNVYNTSPYLEDSDSDGFTDKNEIDSENDPNCPVGRDCYTSALTNPTKTESEQDSSLNSLLDQFQYQEESETSAEVAAGLKDLLGDDLSAEDLRQLLLEYGMDKSVLDQISDEELMKSFGEVMGE